MAKRTATPSRAAPELDTALRSHGLRRTAARIRVLGFMHANPRPLSHGEVVAALEADGLDYATVYRNLMDLAEVGILVRADLGDHVWRFELNKGKDEEAEHPHFVCTDCGSVACLPEGAVKVVPTRKAPRSVNKGKVVVQLKGLCDDCG
jgi:Fur family transcriptional regulator, ferric uptake regulator